MLKSKKNMHAEKNATTSKFGQFLPIKNGTFWVKIGSNPQNEVRPHFGVHNRVQNFILIILGKKK
jgi:hypothetical protein